jgi:hypothetical protein
MENSSHSMSDEVAICYEHIYWLCGVNASQTALCQLLSEVFLMKWQYAMNISAGCVALMLHKLHCANFCLKYS